MAAMKAFQIAIVLGGILVVVGLYFVYPSRSSPESYSDSIAAQESIYFTLDVFWDGYISGSYSESAGRSLTIYVFNSDQFVTYTTQFVAQGLFSTTGSSGPFSADFSSPGKYYLVIDHGPGNEQITQAFTITARIGGTNAVILGVGLGIIALGAFTAFAGYRSKKSTETPRPSQGVVMFEQPKPGEPQAFPATVEYGSQPVPLQPTMTTQPGRAEQLRAELEKLESDIRRMDELRRTQTMANPDLFDRTYSKKVEEAEEVRRKLRSLGQ